MDGETHPCVPGAVTITHTRLGRGGGLRSARQHVPRGSSTRCPPCARGDPGLSSTATQTRRLQHLTRFPAASLAKSQRSIAAKMIKACYRHHSINPRARHTSLARVKSGANVLSRHSGYYHIIREIATISKLPLATRVQHEVRVST